ncbi:MAG: BamA/TamA family outer membrane protein, partial [Synechococcaceae cyanobacterium RL_1_2]|nr:BamA/TamA family outer membrane protein [Synechococcaceae cyanobacterium RL_1_2]
MRGYRQDAFLADNGIFASAEVRLPFARISQWGTVVQLVPFFDIGTIWNDKAMAAPAKSTLSSVGLGLLWNTKDKFTVRLDWGIPLVSIEGPKIPGRKWNSF